LAISCGLVIVIMLSDHLSTVKAETEESLNAADAYLYECGQTARDLSRYGLEILNPDLSSQVEPGQPFTAEVQVKNTGTAVWCGEKTQNTDMPNNWEAYKLRLGTASPQDHVSDLLSDNKHRVTMDANSGIILPGETATFQITGIAPAQSGIYREYYSPVVEQLGWLNNATVKFDLYVGQYGVEEMSKLRYLKNSGSTLNINPDGILQIVIDVLPANQHEYVYLDGKLIHDYLISSGAWDTPTPVGDYVIYNKQELRIGSKSPHYRMPNWIGLMREGGGRFRGYGMHALPYIGNNKNSSYFWKEAIGHLGIPVSHGCIRRSDSDATWLWSIADPDKTKIKVVRGFDRVAFETSLQNS